MTTISLDRAQIATLMRAIGVTEERRKRAEQDFKDAWGYTLADSKSQVRQFLDLEGEDELEHEGWVAKLGKPPESLWIDETAEYLTPEVVYWLFRQGALKLDSAAWKQMVKRSTPEIDTALRAIHAKLGTAPLSVRRAK